MYNNENVVRITGQTKNIIIQVTPPTTFDLMR